MTLRWSREGPMMAPDLPDHLQIDVLPRLERAGRWCMGRWRRGRGPGSSWRRGLLEGLAPGRRPGPGRWPGELTLMADSLGRPLLALGGKPGPGLSFSEAGGMLWGAMAGHGKAGVDAALEQDFQAPYPYSRAFRREEWDWAWLHCQGRAPPPRRFCGPPRRPRSRPWGAAFTPWTPWTWRSSPRPRPGRGKGSGPGRRAGERLDPGPAGGLAGLGRGLSCR